MTTSKLVIVQVLLFVTFLVAPPATEGAATPLAGLWVHGAVACSASGNQPGVGIPGVSVAVVCNGTAAGELLTDISGYFNGVVTNLNGTSVDRSVPVPAPAAQCQAVVRTPVAGCPLLAQPGNLRAPVSIGRNLIRTLIGYVGTTTLGRFEFERTLLVSSCPVDFLYTPIHNI
ncbi:hypothetical protein DM860_010659 [Cuscuta australis]|uniref:Uncharacterized protein n=1 Tax=Cuscuta australis TaxID=267555 RepID=A0A328E663_9ASTE|nr:hypothetical protein DM860_010659 [Cuscuta australis]